MDRKNMENNITLGIDVGGTFTDILAFDHTKGTIFSAFKVPSTPQNPALAAIIGVDRFLSRTDMSANVVFHGTTVGTNALIQKRGSRTALVTTEGFRDVLALRRHARPRLYDLAPRVSPPLVPRKRRIELKERITHDGSVLIPLEPSEVTRAIKALKEASVESVAISLLHAYANDKHEKIIGEAITKAFPDVFVSISNDVCREFREFERTSTVTVNAYIGPTVQRYFDSLKEELIDLVKKHDSEEIIFSEPLSPQQERNLSQLLHCRVFDRTQLILEIFEKGAQTAEGKTQVELAFLQHRKSRLA